MVQAGDLVEFRGEIKAELRQLGWESFGTVLEVRSELGLAVLCICHQELSCVQEIVIPFTTFGAEP